MVDIGIRRFTDPPEPTAIVVALPHAGGSASWFRDWAFAAHDMGMGIWAVQYPGHEELFTASPPEDLEDLARAISSRLADEAHRIVLFGHSMGGLLAHRVAALLHEQGCNPLGLHISATRAPDQPVTDPRHVLSDHDLVVSIGAMSPGEPNPLEDEMVASVLLPQVRFEMKLAETHRSHPVPLLTPIVLHLGDHDPDFVVSDVPAWEKFSTGGIEVMAHRGHHFYLADSQQEILQQIRERLPSVHNSGKDTTPRCSTT